MQEHTYFGDARDFMTVRHVAVHGTNFAIGQQLGELARERYGAVPERFRGDPRFARARRAFLQRAYPIHWARTRGVAAAFGIDPNDDRYDLPGLTYHMDVPIPPPGCSAVYYPPATTVSGGGYLGRNYDFPICSLAEMLRLPLPPSVMASQRPVMSEPYVMSWYPEDGGYPSMAIHAFDLLSGTLDGMNSEGLVVAILADEKARNALGPQLEMHPGAQQAIGLHELQVMRLLLDTCATAEDAQTALLTVKQYYRFMPNHYLVADRAGHSFVYENSTGRNAQHVLDGDGTPQVITNHQLHRHHADAPVGPLTWENHSRWRYHVLRDRLAARPGRVSVEDIKTDLTCVNVFDLVERTREASGGATAPGGIEARTVWRCLYDQQAGTAEFSFYLGDVVGADGGRTERRSEYVRFALDAVAVS
jgi:Acyl-coenzyme A:6-aminopenicillanic acid acyl-transferase